MRRRLLIPCIAFAYLICAPALAQIYQCTDPETGNRTFSDTACPNHSTGKAIEVSPTNVSDPFASEADIAARRKERAIEESKFRSNWQDQNEDARAADRALKREQQKQRDELDEKWEHRPPGAREWNKGSSRSYRSTRPGRVNTDGD